MINEQIRDKEVRVIGEAGNQLGIMSAKEAMKLAREANLDLVKIAPTAKPPVCKIIDYGKYRYEMARKEKEAKKKQKVIEVKEVRLSPNIDSNDLNTKMNNALTDYEGIIANIIYINHKFEQRAFGNGAYQYMMKSNDYNNNFDNAIKDTQLFKWLTHIKNDYVFIKNTPQGHPLLKAALKPYNITYDKLLEITEETIDNLIRMLGRIKSKALDDYREQNEVHSMQEHITKEGMERKWEEIIKINEKYFL